MHNSLFAVNLIKSWQSYEDVGCLSTLKNSKAFHLVYEGTKGLHELMVNFNCTIKLRLTQIIFYSLFKFYIFKD